MVILTVLTLSLFSTTAYGDTYGRYGTGYATREGADTASNFAWGVGLGGLVVLGVMAGLIASSASKNSKTY